MLASTIAPQGASASRMMTAPRMLIALRTTAPSAGFVQTATRAYVLDHTIDLGRMDIRTPMHVTLALKSKLSRADMDEIIRRQNTFGDPLYHHWLSASTVNRLMSPEGRDVQRLAMYLQSTGFTRFSITPDNLLLTAYGTAGSVNRAFDTEMHRETVRGKSEFANFRGASLPAVLSPLVDSVMGLASTNRMHTGAVLKGNAKPAGATAGTSCTKDPLTGVCLLNDFGPRELITAYNAGHGAYGEAINGFGSGIKTNIGIIMEGNVSTVETDLRAEEHSESLPQTPYTVVTVGAPSTDTSGQDEFDLDSQSSSGIAGNVKMMYWYVANSLDDADLTAAIDRAKTDDVVKAVSESIGGCETLAYAAGTLAADDTIYAAMAMQGQTNFASTGDTGGACAVESTNGVPDSGLPEPEYPAIAEYVVGVGGTTLFTTASGNPADNNLYQGETAWYAGGGGVSKYETAPPWQAGVVPAAFTTLKLRVDPDISMVADPDTGFNTYVSGVSEEVGGTSLASPVSLGVWARFESLDNNNFGPAGPIYYAEWAKFDPTAPTYTPGYFTNTVGGFNDIIIGTNGTYPCTPGWDIATGLGSTDIRKTEASLGLPASPTPTQQPPTPKPTVKPSAGPATAKPSAAPTSMPTTTPTTAPTTTPTTAPTAGLLPTTAPSTASPTTAPGTAAPTGSPNPITLP